MARVPEIIRRNPLSQVAATPAPAGQGFAALADIMGMAADFVKPAAERQARLDGQSAVYRDTDGQLKVDEKSVFAGEMGAIHNAAAFSKYLAQKGIDIENTMSELATTYEFDPDGFKKAADGYIGILREDEGVPAVLKDDLISQVEQASARSFNGLYRSQVKREQTESERATATRRDMLADDYTSLIVAGDEEGAAEVWKQIEDISRFRANAPYMAETDVEREAYLRGVKGSATYGTVMRKLEDLEGADEISDELRAEIIGLSESSNLNSKQRQALYTATQGRLKAVDAAGIVKGLTDGSYEGRVIQMESGGRNDARPIDPKTGKPLSSALGPHQFIAGTWMGLIEKYEPGWAKGKTRQEILEFRKDRAKSSEMFAHFRRENQSVLAGAGVSITPATEYMAHVFGAGTAVKLINSGPNTMAVDVIGKSAENANPWFANMTVRDLQNWAARKMHMSAQDIANQRVQVDQIEDDEVRALAARELADRIQKQQAVENATASEYEERLVHGDPTLTEQEVLEELNLSLGDQSAIVRQLRAANKKQEELTSFTARLAQGGQFNAMDSGDLGLLNDAQRAVLGDQSPLGTPEATQTSYAVAKQADGTMARDTFTAFRTQLQSSDPEALGATLETLAQFAKLGDTPFANYDGRKGVEDMLADFEWYGQFGSAQEAAAQIIKNREEKPKNLTDQAKEVVKGLTIDEVTRHFDKWIFSNPQIGVEEAGEITQLTTAVQENAMMADYSRLVKDAFLDTGDAELAKNRALKQMDRIYGVNMVSGKKRLMRYAPNGMYPAIGGSHDWMTRELERGVSAFVYGEEIASELGGLINMGNPNEKWIDAGRIKLHSDEVTAAEVRAGVPPSYVVFYANDDGQIEQIPQRFDFDVKAARAQGRMRTDEINAGAMDERSAGQDFEDRTTLDRLMGLDGE